VKPVQLKLCLKNKITIIIYIDGGFVIICKEK